MPDRRSSSPGSPGLRGAIKDAVAAVADFTAPRSVVQRKKKLKQQEDSAMGRMREGQSTDSNNDY